MNRIIVSFIILIFMVTNTTFGFAGYYPSMNNEFSYDIQQFQNDMPAPGCLENGKLDLISNYSLPMISFQPNLSSVEYNTDIVSLIQLVNEDLYLDYLEEIVAFGPRVTSYEECQDAGYYIYYEFLEMGIDARIQEWDNDNLFGFNIEGTIQGKDESSDEIFIICAHYDSVPGSPGADDDGSGVAAVMTAAKVMSYLSFNNTIKFVLFSGEEQGLYGSNYYVEEAYNNDDNIIAALNVDMIGFALSDEDSSYIQVFEDDSSEWLAEYTININEEYMEIFDLEIILSGYSGGSDHYRFWEAGYNAIFYAEYNFNDFYHSPEDIIENMNISYATRASQLIIATLGDLSEIQPSNIPYKPDPPIGPTSGKIHEEYVYSAYTTDPNDDDLLYLFDWGDGTDSGWQGPIQSGETYTISHSWNDKGTYSIMVKVKDINNLESAWSDPIDISMPKEKKINIQLLQLLENHPLMFPLLQRLLNQ